MKRVLHIVPATPPAFNGLGDYARMLYQSWPDPQTEWHVAALELPDGHAEAWPGVVFHEFGPTVESLEGALRASGCETVALHYVPHGFHPKGVPAWLPKGLERWKAGSGGRLAVFFHELFAYGPPWRSSFWLAPGAVSILRRIVALSDAAMTSNALYGRMLKAYGGLGSLPEIVPIGSNIPAVAKAQPPGPGPWRVAVFGTEGTRTKALRMNEPLLRKMADEGKIEAIVLIGTRGGGMDGALIEGVARVERVHDATPHDASVALAACHLGITAAIPSILPKSGVYAAYCAHRLIAVVQGRKIDLPYLAEDGGDLGRLVHDLGRSGFQDDLLREVDAYAAASDWSVIAARWASLV